MSIDKKRLGAKAVPVQPRGSVPVCVPVGSDGREVERRAFIGDAARSYTARLAQHLRGKGFNAEEAADLVQDAFVRLCRYDEWPEIDYPQAFLYTAAVNLARDRAKHLRYRYANGHVSIDDVNVASETPSAERAAQAEQELAVVRRALAELSPKCRAVFVLHRFDDLSYKKIADKLGLSVSMVEKYISQALAHCRERVEAARALPPRAPAARNTAT